MTTGLRKMILILIQNKYLRELSLIIHVVLLQGFWRRAMKLLFGIIMKLLFGIIMKLLLGII